MPDAPQVQAVTALDTGDLFVLDASGPSAPSLHGRVTHDGQVYRVVGELALGPGERPRLLAVREPPAKLSGGSTGRSRDSR